VFAANGIGRKLSRIIIALDTRDKQFAVRDFAARGNGIKIHL